MRGDDHVDLRSDAEVFEIDARLDRKAGSREQAPIVVRLVIVHVDAVAVDRLPETVARPVEDLRGVAPADDHLARGAIDLPAANLASGARALLHETNRRIACVADRLERACEALRHVR